MRLSGLVFAAALLVLSAGRANAAVVTWTIDSSRQILGTNCCLGTLGGSFDYDRDTNTYSNISLTAVAFGGPDRSYATIVGGSTDLVMITSQTGGTGLLQLHFLNALTNAGAPAGNPFFAFEDAVPASPGQTFSYLGSISAVPVPAALPLFLSALVGLGLIARRRKQAA